MGERLAEPVMRSVAHRRHAALGATFERRGAWAVPARYESLELETEALRTALGFADVSARGKVHLSGEVGALARALTGSDPDPLRTASIESGGLLARIARDWALALVAPSAEGEVLGALEAEQSDAAMITDLTSALSAFVVAGPRLEDFLARTVNLDLAGLRPGRCVAATWARIPTVLVIRELAEPAVELYVGSDHGRYAWDTLHRLAGTAVGWGALESWGWKP
jgi:glycine cleavage system T protein (aminomethyltransferase)